MHGPPVSLYWYGVQVLAVDGVPEVKPLRHTFPPEETVEHTQFLGQSFAVTHALVQMNEGLTP